MKYTSLILLFVLFSCGEKETILLPKSDNTVIKEVRDYSPIYLLKMYHLTALGEMKHEENKSLADLSILEATPMIVLSIMTIGFGLYPKAVIALYDGTINFLITKGL
jgi:NADH:ubiquinone oxidoreductase subunit 4 (subunit M)